MLTYDEATADGLVDEEPEVPGPATNGRRPSRSGGQGDQDGWAAPIPLGRAGHQLPAFPVDALPGWARDFVVALAEATQTPVDLAGVLVLSVLATAAGGRAVVEVRDGWREPLNLFTATALPPGARKTPVFQRVTEPLQAAERDAAAAARPVIAEAVARRKAAQAVADKAQAEADHASDDARAGHIHVAAVRRLEADGIVVPATARLLADDATPEALTSLIAEQGGRMAVLSDEGDVFNMMAGRYSKNGGPNLAVYLKGHAGSTLRVDRKGREPEFIEAPALTLGLAVQPAVLEALADLPGARGLGLLARFLWSLPASNVGSRKVAASPVPADVTDRYATNVITLVASLGGLDEVTVLEFTSGADEELRWFEEQLEPRLAAHGDLGHVADWASKLAGHAARIAGLLHLADHVHDGEMRHGWKGPVAGDTVAAARRIAEYFVDHALAAFDLVGSDAVMADARHLAGWLKARDPFTRRDVHQANRSRFPKVTDLDPVLELLEAHGYIRQQPPAKRSPAGGRPPSPIYEPNPLIP